MARKSCDDEQFIQMFMQLGATQTAKELNILESSVYHRRRRLEDKLGKPIWAPATAPTDFHPERRTLDVQNGKILVGSDAHYWPNIATTAHRAFVSFIASMIPLAVVMNGDVFDGASISRHAPIAWEDRPSVADEIDACKVRLGEIETAAKTAKLFFLLGNHDARFESRLATVAPEYIRVTGVHLKDHFPKWLPSWSLLVNDNVMIKHRFKGGIHATHNNTLWAGITMVTGHLHSLKVTPLSDYQSTRWGVDTGTLADTYGPQFRDYLEDNPRNWRSGFVVLTFKDGKLLWPELVHVIEPGIVEFRGETIEV